MKSGDIKISQLDLISGTEALAIFGVKYKSQLQKMIETYQIPHKKLKRNRIFLRSDIESVQNSSRRQANIDRNEGKNPRKIVDDIQFGIPFDITKVDLIGVSHAMEILSIKHANQFHITVERYEIPHKRLSSGAVFLRSDIEKVKKSARRTENLRRRHGKEK